MRTSHAGALFLFLITFSAGAQTTVRGHFEADSIRVGQVVPFTLSTRYNKAEQVLFPDSTFDFRPFEYAGRQFVPTRTAGDESYDSVTYFLTTFETDKVQRLHLPVFVVHESDCVIYQSETDSLFLSTALPAALDSISAAKLPLKTNTNYQPVAWLLNYPVLVIISAGIILLLVVIWVVFGKRIRRYFALRKLHKSFAEFVVRFHESMNALSRGFNSRQAEETLLVWKRYMENLERFPYTKSTSREILRNAADPTLGRALHAIDRGIYGGKATPLDDFRMLENYTRDRFQKMEDKLKHG